MSFYNIIIWTLDEWNVPYKMLNGWRDTYEYCFYLEKYATTLHVSWAGNVMMCKPVSVTHPTIFPDAAQIETIQLAAPESIDQLRDFIFGAK